MNTLRNNIIWKVAGVGLIISLVIMSCKKYLEVSPQGLIEEEAIRNDPQAAEALVTGVYNGLWNSGMHGFSYVGMTNIASDDADKGSNPTDNADNIGMLDRLAMTPSVNALNDLWTGYFRGVVRANQALDKLPLSPAAEEVKKRLEGEVRFVRGLLYFDLVRFFGKLPKLDRVPATEEANSDKFQVRASVDSIYDFIISDLEFALANLPIKGAAGAQVGRATKGAAAGLLAKVFLYRQNYQRAFSLSDSIVTQKLGDYGLLDNYASIWRETGSNGRESLFEVQTGINAKCEAAIGSYVVCQGPRAGGQGGWADLGWGFGGPSQSLLDAYEPGDKRKDATVIFINPGGTVLWDGFRVPGKDSVENFRYNYKAYHSRGAERNCGKVDYLPKNLRVLRFGEIKLIHAEAALALGNAGAAIQDISDLRIRAGFPTGVTIVTRESIWKERRVEMALEHDRFFDLIRQNKVSPGRAASEFSKDGKVFTANKNEVFPIPQQQIDLSQGKMDQNDGYN